MELDRPVATVLPKATEISRPFASWVKYILSRRGLVRSINRSLPVTFIVRGDAYSVARGNGTQLTISLANCDRLARSAAGLCVLSMANRDDKAMDTLGTLWKSNWEVRPQGGRWARVVYAEPPPPLPPFPPLQITTKVPSHGRQRRRKKLLQVWQTLKNGVFTRCVYTQYIRNF